jgi:hypothetical protein
MSIDLKNDRENIKSKISSFKTSVNVSENTKKLKDNFSGDNLQDNLLKNVENLTDILTGKTEDFKKNIKNQYEELIDLFKLSSNDSSNSDGRQSVDFLLDQLLNASKNTVSRIVDIFISELISTAGCSEEQLFNGCDENDNNCPNKIYIRVNQVDLYRVLYLNPNEGNNSLFYESEETNVGDIPFSLNRELYNRLQNPGVSYKDEYGDYYKGGSGNSIMDIRYVTSFIDTNGDTQEGDYFEITLINRVSINNISDFLVDYYKSIDIISLDELLINLMNSVTNYLDISIGRSEGELSERSRFEKIINRILGLCFDSNEEIDVSGIAKTSELDVLNDSFFTVDNIDLRNIENEVNNIRLGVVELEDCDNVKLPVNVDFISNGMKNLRGLPVNQKINGFVNMINEISEDENFNQDNSGRLSINVSLKNDLLKNIPLSIVNTVLSPKSVLGIMMVLKSVESQIIDGIEDLETFKNNMKTFLVNITSKITSIFIEELFNLLKKNINELVRILLKDITLESKNSKIVMITSILSLLLGISSLVTDWRKCKSVIDDILYLLSLKLPNSGISLPNIVLAGSSLLEGYSATRAMTNIIEGIERLGLPTGDLPSGASNVAIPAIFEQIKGNYQEQLQNGKTEVFIPPLSVIALGGGTTFPAKGVGKSF